MKIYLKYAIRLMLLLIIGFVTRISAQIPVRKGPASDEEIKKARTVVDAHMDSIGAHKTYIYAMGISNPRVVEQYKTWIKEYPENINIPLAIATVYYNAEMPQAKEFLLKAAEIDPKNAKVWSMLSGDALRWGKHDLAITYMRKATLADPSNADYATYYLMCFLDSNQTLYKQKAFNLIKRFPTNQHSAMALYWVGEGAENIDSKIGYLEELRKSFPPQKFSWSADGMSLLADAYLQTNPSKALNLINEMGDDKNLQIRKQVAESLIRTNGLEHAQKYKDAVTEINQIKLPRYNQIDEFITLKKATLQDKAGDVKGAYDSLAIKFAKIPTDQLYNALELYGKKIGKDNTQIATDIETIRNRTALVAFPFELGLYTSDVKLNLKDLKGKVVLLTFWFPGCGPCAREFPHFQAVINKFKGEDVVYVGVNVVSEQDPYVLHFVENNNYSFIPLRGNEEFARKNYGVRGEPENFLIDKDGKIIFKDFRINKTNHRTLELMVSSLLKKKQ